MYGYNNKVMDDKVFKFIYGCAMADAIGQRAFYTKGADKKWVLDVVEARNEVRHYITRVLRGEFWQNTDIGRRKHDIAFLFTAYEVCRYINTSPLKPEGFDSEFTFGNAQKLINMVVKHVYAVTYQNAALRERFLHCHCPIDSRMLDRVWDLHGEQIKKDGAFKTKGKFIEAWSNEKFDDKHPTTVLPQRYANFQKFVLEIIGKNGGDIYPIEFDYFEW